MEMTSKKVINRIFNALILLFFATPFLFMFYGQLQQGSPGLDFQVLIAENPNLNILFITSFITPFIGYYMLRLKQELNEDADVELILSHLILAVISFVIMGNVTYGLFISILTYFIFRNWKIGFKEVPRYFKKNGINLTDFLAPIAFLIVAILVRVMLILVTNA
jgi:hypothetical protein